MKSLKMEQESILDMLTIDRDLFKSKILKEYSQGLQIHHELALLHKNLKDVKLIYQGSRDGYDTKKLISIAKDYSFTFSVIESNHGKIFGAYTPI